MTMRSDDLLKQVQDLRKRYLGVRGKIMSARSEAILRKTQDRIAQVREKINKT